MDPIQLGDIAKDTITGLQGVVVSRTMYLHGCVRLGLQPQELKDGKPVDLQWFDEPQLELVRAVNRPAPAKRGGPQPSPVRSADPTR